MSTNKKVFIGFILGIIIVTILSIIGVTVYKSKHISNTASGEADIREEIQDDTIQENAITNTEVNNSIQENNIIDEEQNSNVNSEKQQEIQNNSTPVSSKKEETTQTQTSKPKVEQPKEQEQSKPTVITEKTNENNKESQTQTVNKDNSYTESPVELAPKKECIGNNHKISAGNTGKWFETQAQADSFYNAEIEKWGKKWESGEIEKDEYLKKCPSGYEVWTCPQCQKWTINFYYR